MDLAPARHRRLVDAAILAIATTIALSLPSQADADRGVRLDPGRIAVDAPLAPGQTYALPTLGVSNPGDESATYTMQVRELAGATAPDAAWFEFDPASFDLIAGQMQPVRVTMRVPASAGPGEYTALLAAQIGSTTAAGVGVGAAAAARLTFTVKPSSELAALLNVAAAWITDHGLGFGSLLIVLTLTLVTVVARRHLTIVVRRR